MDQLDNITVSEELKILCRRVEHETNRKNRRMLWGKLRSFLLENPDLLRTMSDESYEELRKALRTGGAALTVVS